MATREELQAEIHQLRQRIAGLLADAEKLTEERDLWREVAEHYEVEAP
jgi:hypothetical protein